MLALAGALVVAGCGVKSTPARPGNYDYPGTYPAQVDDMIIEGEPDVPRLGMSPVYRRPAADVDAPPASREVPPPAGEVPPPATETIIR